MIKKFLLVLMSACAITLLGATFQFLLSPQDKLAESAISYPAYLHYSAIHPGQLRYSSRQVEEKKQAAIQKNKAIWSEDTRQWNYLYFEGKSILSTRESLPVVKTCFGYVLVDGHHDVLSSLALGAEWIPIKVIKDFGDLSPEDFWRQAEKEGLVYLYDLKGNPSVPGKSFSSLIDDPIN